MNNVELLMNNPPNTKLDLEGTTDIDLQYSIADIRDLSKRNSAYSKTILLSGSKNNNYWLGNLYDINSDFTSFNLNKKTECKLTVNSETVIDGFFQLKTIRKFPTDDNHGFYVIYEIVIYNNSVDLMTELGERTLADLDMSRYDHIFKFENIVGSWNNTYLDGYVYNLTGTNEYLNLYQADWLYPSMFLWTIFDNMLSEARFGWKGSFKNNKQFQHEILTPAMDGRPNISEENRVSRSFKVGRVDDGPWEAVGTVPVGAPWWYNIPTNTLLPIDNKTGMDFFDNDNNFNTTTHQWIVNKNGKYSVDYNILMKFALDNQSGNDAKFINLNFPTQPNLTGYKNFKIISSVYLNGTEIPSSSSQQLITYSYTDNGGIIPDGSSFYFNDVINLSSSSDEINLVIGDVLELRIKVEIVPSIYGWDNNLAINGKLLTGSSFENNPMTNVVTQGDMIEMKSFLPDKVKLKDIVQDLVARYNLYIEVDPDNDRLLIIDSRPDYYARGGTDDWTDLKDYGSEDNIQFVSELQTKKMKWTYKDDGDLPNKSYKEATGDTYGQYTHTFDNDFVMGEKKIESPFSPSPSIKTSFGAILPFIDPESPKVNTRILYYGGLKPSPSVWTLEHQDIVNGGTIQTHFNKYPYSGHFDDPINPTLDINFGICKFYLYTDNNFLTTNNMYNTYWSDYVNQIEEGRMVTSKFYLTEDKIRKIRNNLNTKIYVKDSWFYINKISSYKPLENGLTTVELIKMIDGVQFKPQPVGGKVIGGRVPGFSVGVTIKDGRKIVLDKIGFNNKLNVGSIISGNDNKGGGNVISKVDTIYNLSDWILDTGSWDDNGFWRDTAQWYDSDPGIVGYTSSVGITNSHIIRPNRQIIIGDNNSVSRDMGLILGGDNNIIDAENSSVINGSGNTISMDGYGTTIIQADGLNVIQPNRIHLGLSFSVDAINGDMFLGNDPVRIGPKNLSETLDIGNTSDGYDIRMTDQSLLRSDLLDNWIDLNDTNSAFLDQGIYILSRSHINLDTPNLISTNIGISDGTYINRIETEPLLDNRLIKFPDKNGTVALKSDVETAKIQVQDAIMDAITLDVKVVTDDYTIQVDDDIILFEAAGPNKVVTLPPSLDLIGRVIRIKSGNVHGIRIDVHDPLTEKVDNGNDHWLLGVNEKVMLISRPLSGSMKGWVTF